MSSAEEERERETLRRRAREIARPDIDKPAEEGPETLDLVCFQVDGGTYALETRIAVQVHPLRQLTPLPGGPPHMRGIVIARGRVLPVMDLCSFLGLPARGLTDLHRVIELHSGELRLGVLAQLGVDLRRVRRDGLQPPLAAHAGGHSEYVLGMTADGVVVLDAQRILDDPRIVVDEEPAG